jgi:hypothetical protein
MDVDKKNQAETRLYYESVLSKAIPGNGVYYKHCDKIYNPSHIDQQLVFNFELDTLALRPSQVLRETTLKLTGEEVIKEHMLEWFYTAGESLECLKAKLKDPENNLGQVQSIAIGGFDWYLFQDPTDTTDQVFEAK